jgi:hypothetical protein
VWGFVDFEGVNYLIFREKVPKFPPIPLLLPLVSSQQAIYTKSVE